MNGHFDGTREERRRRFLRNLPWMLPVAMVLGTGLFIGLAICGLALERHAGRPLGIKTISFWQAWGLVLLSQILFKGEHPADDAHRSLGAPSFCRRRCSKGQPSRRRRDPLQKRARAAGSPSR